MTDGILKGSVWEFFDQIEDGVTFTHKYDDDKSDTEFTFGSDVNRNIGWTAHLQGIASIQSSATEDLDWKISMSVRALHTKNWARERSIE